MVPAEMSSAEILPSSEMNRFIRLLKKHYKELASVAWQCLAEGATEVSLWDSEHRLLQHWPKEKLPEANDFCVPLLSDKIFLAEIRLGGKINPAMQNYLQGQARFLGQLIERENELENIATELIEKQDQLIALYELSYSMRSNLDAPSTLLALTEAAVRILGVDSAFAVMLENGKADITKNSSSLLDEATILKLFRQMQTNELELILNNGESHEILSGAVRNLLFVPILVRNKLMAGLGLVNKDGIFGSPELKLTRAIAQQGGAQLENVLLYQETLAQAKLKTELELASQIQLRLLPHTTPKVTGLDVFGRAVPAQQVGGDFYDFIDQPGRPFIFTLGDVSGKGISAALLMTMIRTVLHNAAKFSHDPMPEAIISRVAEDLYDDFTEVSKFATVFVGNYDSAHRELHYANAGHSPVIYCPLGGPARLLIADGPALGVVPVNLSENQMIPFNPGDVLVVATDGFSEAQNDQGEFYGYDRLLELVEQQAEKSASEIGHSLLKVVNSFGAGHPQDDDQTLVVIKGVV